MFFVFFVFWIVLNGKINVEIAVTGAIIALGVFLFCCKFMEYSIKKDIVACKVIGLAICYVLLLIWEIVKANVGVMRFVYNQREDVEPCVIEMKAPFKINCLNVILADSITLTPGTITVELTGDRFTIHCLDQTMSEGMENSSFVRLLKKIEKEVKAC
ncbi:MAG: Na+/H+ antiporter subunit E [Eubacterium sp.]